MFHYVNYKNFHWQFHYWLIWLYQISSCNITKCQLPVYVCVYVHVCTSVRCCTGQFFCSKVNFTQSSTHVICMHIYLLVTVVGSLHLAAIFSHLCSQLCNCVSGSQPTNQLQDVCVAFGGVLAHVQKFGICMTMWHVGSVGYICNVAVIFVQGYIPNMYTVTLGVATWLWYWGQDFLLLLLRLASTELVWVDRAILGSGELFHSEEILGRWSWNGRWLSRDTGGGTKHSYCWGLLGQSLFK